MTNSAAVRIVNTHMGPARIEATARGVRSIAPCEHGGVAEAPAVAGAERWLNAAQQALEACARGERPELPELDVVATDFQRAVWAAACAIPAGASTTYGVLAVSLGAPGAARAVGAALAANPLWWVIPCHRVSGADGSPRGFAWGVPLKRAMLAHERTQALIGSGALA